MKVGIIALSFGIGKNGPGLSNYDLANAIDWLCLELNQRLGSLNDVKIVAQWEIAAEIERRPEKLTRFASCLTATVFGEPNQYLGSEGVILEAKEYLDEAEETWIVAMPFLHSPFCRKLAKKHGFKNVQEYKGFRLIRFDKRSRQWWTKGKLRLLTYSILCHVLRLGRGKQNLFWDTHPKWVENLNI